MDETEGTFHLNLVTLHDTHKQLPTPQQETKQQNEAKIVSSSELHSLRLHRRPLCCLARPFFAPALLGSTVFVLANDLPLLSSTLFSSSISCLETSSVVSQPSPSSKMKKRLHPAPPPSLDPSALFAEVFRENEVIYQCTWIWFCLAIVAVGLRFFSRMRVVGKFGWDDATMLVGMTSYMAFSIILFSVRHWAQFKEEPSSDPIQGMRELAYYGDDLWRIQSLIYTVGIAFTRTSVGLLYLRIIPSGTKPWARITSIVIILINMTSSTAVFFIDLFECRPVGAARSNADFCMDPNVLPLTIIIYSLLSLIVDCVFAFLPVGVLCGMQIKRRKKIGAMILMSMGLLATGTIVWRLVFLLQPGFITIQQPKGGEEPDQMWFITKPVLKLKVNMMLSWTIEQSVALMAASFATYKPLYKFLREKYLSKIHYPVRNSCFCRRIFGAPLPPSIRIRSKSPTPLGSPTIPNNPGYNAYTRRMAEYCQVGEYELCSRQTPSTESDAEKNNWTSSTDEESPVSPAFPTFSKTNSTQALISLTPTSVRFGDGTIEAPQPSPTPTTTYERSDAVAGLPTIPSGQVLSISHSQSQSTIQSIPVDYNELFYGMPATLTEARIRGSSTQGSDVRSRR
ncbi:hypothetical protein V8F06_006129 [Rhypophila decipiens]